MAEDSFEEQLKRDAIARQSEPQPEPAVEEPTPAPEPTPTPEPQEAPQQGRITIRYGARTPEDFEAQAKMQRVKDAFSGAGRAAGRFAERAAYEGGRVAHGLATRAGRYTAKKIEEKLQPAKEAHEYAVNPDYKRKAKSQSLFASKPAKPSGGLRINPSLLNFNFGKPKAQVSKPTRALNTALAINPAFTNFNFKRTTATKGKPLFGGTALKPMRTGFKLKKFDAELKKRKISLGLKATNFKLNTKWTVFGGRKNK